MNAIVQAPRAWDDLPKRQREFVEQYVKTGDAERAYLAVGYKPSKHQRAKAAQLKCELRPYITQKTRELSESNEMAILGMRVVAELAQSAESEGVRFQAAKYLADKALPDAPKEVIHSHTVRNLTEEQIDARIEALTQRLGYGNVIDVTPDQG